jgi:hypothetical protein
MSMKKSNDTVGNRTRDLPACSAEPQPTAPPHAPCIFTMFAIDGKFLSLLLRSLRAKRNMRNVS